MGLPFWLHRLLDTLVSVCVLAPLVVAYWRGTFLLLTIYIVPSNEDISLALSSFIGVSGGVVFIYLQDIFRDFIHHTSSPISEIILKRFYAYFFGIIVVNHWRAVWGYWDKYTGADMNSGFFCYLIGMLGLMLLRCYRNSISPPVVAASDLHDDFFEIKTRFRVPRSKRVLYFLDSLFSVVVPGSLIVMNCRGFWYILNNLMISLDWYSFLISGGIGIFLVFVALFLQKPAAALSRRLDGRSVLLKIIFEDAYMMVAGIAGVNIWRSVWGLCDTFVFPADQALSSWSCHILGMAGLMLMFHGSTALIKGFQIDGEFNNGEGCILAASSFTIFQEDMGQTHRGLENNVGLVEQRDVIEEEGKLMKESHDGVKMEHTILSSGTDDNGDTNNRNQYDENITTQQNKQSNLPPWEEKFEREPSGGLKKMHSISSLEKT